MKNLLTIAIVLSSATAFATRARVTALGNSPHLVDTASSSADQLMSMGDSFTLESGATATALVAPAGMPTTLMSNGTNAEGTLYKTMGEGKLGLSLGHQDNMVYTMRSAAQGAIAGIKAQQNPLEVSYAMKMSDMAVSGTLIYSNFNNKTASEKESTMGVKVGVSNSMFYGNLKLMATDKYEAGAVEYKGKPGFDIKGGMNFGETLSAHANIVSTGFKTSNGAADTNDVEAMLISLKLVDAMKKDGNSFFYGVGLSTNSVKEKLSDAKTTTLNLPLIIGLEATATSWLTLRASVAQDVLLSNTKTDPGNEFNPGVNTTTYAAGASLVFNKISVDGTINNGATQTINSGNLLGTVGLTYWF